VKNGLPSERAKTASTSSPDGAAPRIPTSAWGRWVGMSYDGPVVSGWGAIARTEDQAHQVVLDLINESRP
jgi:hypothetical protein